MLSGWFLKLIIILVINNKSKSKEKLEYWVIKSLLLAQKMVAVKPRQSEKYQRARTKKKVGIKKNIFIYVFYLSGVDWSASLRTFQFLKMSFLIFFRKSSKFTLEQVTKIRPGVEPAKTFSKSFWKFRNRRESASPRRTPFTGRSRVTPWRFGFAIDFLWATLRTSFTFCRFSPPQILNSFETLGRFWRKLFPTSSFKDTKVWGPDHGRRF